ncbi:hypothetical protein [Massilia varians]|uniref:hypothetical protein n=1 Tax=Massilia varians TaxID=457921 RepID=UPI002555CEFC|nr:hypothetical protein [Massilia varians]MDK6077948.1 hypothetical protein [Massilia varians]
MKRLLLALLFVAPGAPAQEISCPKFYPSQDAALPEVPYEHKGKGLVRRQELTGANWMGGELGDTSGEMVGGVTKVKGGRDLAVPSFARWMVCSYGGGVSWWEELKPETVKGDRCVIQVREKVGRDPMDAKMVCKAGR